jgi:PAS domain S-box-containing protein
MSPSRDGSVDASAPWARAFLEALRAGDATAAQDVAERALLDGIGPAAVHSRVIEPAMHRIGDLWERGVLTVADEHLATSISHGVLARLVGRLLTAAPRSRERVLLAAPEGERHVLGLRMAGDVLEGAGFDVLYLGADVPTDALVRACRTHAPAIVGLSVTTTGCVPALIAALAEIQRWEERPAIMLGGRALRSAFDRGLRVAAVTLSEDAVSVVESLLAKPPLGPLVPDDLIRPSRPSTTTAVAPPDASGAMAHAPAASSAAARDAGRRAFALERLQEEALHHLEALSSNALVGFGFVSRGLRIVRVNRAVAEMIGLTHEQLVGRTLAEAAPDAWRETELIYRRVLETGAAVINVELARMSASRGLRRLLASFYPVGSETAVVGVGVVLIDITDRKRRDDELALERGPLAGRSSSSPSTRR